MCVYTVKLHSHFLHIFLNTYTSASYHDVAKFSSAREIMRKMKSITSFVDFDQVEFDDCYTKQNKCYIYIYIALFISWKIDSYSSSM